MGNGRTTTGSNSGRATISESEKYLESPGPDGLLNSGQRLPSDTEVDRRSYDDHGEGMTANLLATNTHKEQITKMVVAPATTDPGILLLF